MTNLPHLIEAALLLLVAYLIGCLIGYFLRAHVFKTTSAAAPKPAAAPAQPAAVAAAQPPAKPATAKAAPAAPKAPAAKPAPKAAAKPAAKAAPKKALSPPETLDAPRGGEKDNLKTIKGIGPKIEGQLNALGIYHLDQIAGWNSATIGWVDDHLSFKGRIDREKWVPQAKALVKPAK